MLDKIEIQPVLTHYKIFSHQEGMSISDER